jgi:hypothetical protein
MARSPALETRGRATPRLSLPSERRQDFQLVITGAIAAIATVSIEKYRR